MIRALAPLLALLALDGCRSRPFDETPLTDGGPRDLARSIDLAQVDLTQSIDLTQPTTCSALVDCMAHCGTWMPDQPDCYQECGRSAPTMWRDGFTQYGTCAVTYCLGGWLPVQNPTYIRCAIDATKSSYVDGAGAPAGDCQACLHHALDALFQLPCPASDPACADLAHGCGGTPPNYCHP